MLSPPDRGASEYSSSIAAQWLWRTEASGRMNQPLSIHPASLSMRPRACGPHCARTNKVLQLAHASPSTPLSRLPQSLCQMRCGSEQLWRDVFHGRYFRTMYDITTKSTISEEAHRRLPTRRDFLAPSPQLAWTELRKFVHIYINMRCSVRLGYGDCSQPQTTHSWQWQGPSENASVNVNKSYQF